MSDGWNQDETEGTGLVTNVGNVLDGEMPNLHLKVLGKMKDGHKLVKSGWSGETTTLSDRAIIGIQSLGIPVIDEPKEYLF